MKGHKLPDILREVLIRQSNKKKASNNETNARYVDIVLENHPMDCRVKIADDGVVQTLNARMGTGGGNVPLILTVNEQTLFTMQAFGVYKELGVASTIKSRDYKDATDLVVEKEGARRLTPLECERLQGFPDGWTDIGEWIDSSGKVHKKCIDSDRYKAIGNSIAIPPWTYVLERLSPFCGVEPTMASLFDGIGGFPLIWERINGQVSCLWASEIAEFPIAVTKHHFPEEG